MRREIIKLLGGFTLEEYELIERQLSNANTNLIIKTDSIKSLVCENTDYSEFKLKYAGIIQKYGKYVDLQTFLKYLKENVTASSVVHNANTFVIDDKGKRRMIQISQPCHKFLYWMPNIKEKYVSFTDRVLGETKYDKLDDLVFDFNIQINKLIKPDEKYRTDKLAWGKDEVWETCDVLYETLVEQSKGLDCESIGFFKYYCLYAASEKRGLLPQFLERVRMMFCKVVTGEYHINIAFIKEGPNDWIPIETTWFPDDFITIWTKNITISSSGLYPEIVCSFDMFNEYVKLE